MATLVYSKISYFYRKKGKGRNRIFNLNLYLTFFLAFSGYYVGLMMVSNYASINLSRMFTIPVRLILLAGMYILYKLSNQNIRTSGYVAFLIFAGFYLIRICFEIVFGNDEFYMPKNEFILYFTAFVLAPFIFISRTFFTDIDYQSIIKSILISCLLLSLFSFHFYGDLIGKVSRISHEIKHGENYISPLALSYCGSLGIGIGTAFLMTNKISRKKLIWISLIIISCFIPFFLGASRGSVLSLGLPFILYLLFSRGGKSKARTLFTVGVGIASLIYATEYLGTGVFDRFFGIEEAIKSGSSSTKRLDIWQADFNQFLNNPIFGNSLESEYAGHYSHNILIETLITTGILGFIPFLIFLLAVFRQCIRIIRYSPEYFWIPVILIQAFVQYMFSGAIWGMSWVAIGAGLTLGFTNKKRS